MKISEIADRLAEFELECIPVPPFVEAKDAIEANLEYFRLSKTLWYSCPKSSGYGSNFLTPSMYPDSSVSVGLPCVSRSSTYEWWCLPIDTFRFAKRLSSSCCAVVGDVVWSTTTRRCA